MNKDGIIEELKQELESIVNFIRRLTFDPRINSEIKCTLMIKVNDLEIVVEKY